MAPPTERRVRFAAAESCGSGADAIEIAGQAAAASDEITPVGEAISRKRSRPAIVEEVRHGGKQDELSLFKDNEEDEGLTAFDIEEELAGGDKLTEKDGVIPKALAALAVDKTPSVSSSSGEEAGDAEEAKKQKARERKTAADEGEWSDQEAGGDDANGDRAKRRRVGRRAVGDLGEEICAVAARLRVEETPARLVRRYGRDGDTDGIERVTEVCQVLIEGGVPDVYETRREGLLAKCGGWRLRWSNDQGGTVHGPFDAGQMRAWGEAGYFAQEGNSGVVQVGEGTWWAADKLFPRKTG